MTDGDHPFDIGGAKADDVAALAKIGEHYGLHIIAILVETRPTRPGWKHGAAA